jgi:hypothetical protein
MGLGFQFEVPFQEQFASLSLPLRWTHLVALTLMLVTVVAVIVPMMFDLIVFQGQAAEATQACATFAVEFALVPFALSLGFSLAACIWPTAGAAASLSLAGLFVILCFFLWYCYPYYRCSRIGDEPRRTQILFPMKRPKGTPLSTRMRDVLTEARIILPGAQAMLGFQMVAFLTKAFSELPISSKWSHVAAVLLLLVCIVLLMAPPAFHRLVEEGEETERLHTFSEGVVFLAAIPFGLSLVFDFFVAVRMVTHSVNGAIVGAAAVGLLCVLAWYAFPFLFRSLHPDVKV